MSLLHLEPGTDQKRTCSATSLASKYYILPVLLLPAGIAQGLHEDLAELLLVLCLLVLMLPMLQQHVNLQGSYNYQTANEVFF